MDHQDISIASSFPLGTQGEPHDVRCNVTTRSAGIQLARAQTPSPVTRAHRKLHSDGAPAHRCRHDAAHAGERLRFEESQRQQIEVWKVESTRTREVRRRDIPKHRACGVLSFLWRGRMLPAGTSGAYPQVGSVLGKSVSTGEPSTKSPETSIG